MLMDIRYRRLLHCFISVLEQQESIIQIMNRKLGITVREELMLYIELFRKCDQLDKLTYNRTE